MSQYDAFIAHCRTKPVPESGEWHHIVPRSQWPGYKREWRGPEKKRWELESGVNDPSNLIFLSHRDHIEAHYIYATETGKCWQAVWLMLGQMNRGAVIALSEEELEALKETHAILRQVSSRSPVSADSRAKMSASAKRRKARETSLEQFRKLAEGTHPFQTTKAARVAKVRNHNHRHFKWRRDDGVEYTGTVYDLAKKYELNCPNVTKVLYGVTKSVGSGTGTPKWRIVEEL